MTRLGSACFSSLRAVVLCALCVFVASGCEDKVSNGGDGNDPVKLLVDSPPGAQIERPAWIGNDTIVFSQFESTTNRRLLTVNVNGGHPVRFIEDNARAYRHPAFSPELGVVAFEIIDDVSNPSEGSNIDAVLRDNVGRRTRVASQSSGSATYPTWGPDGTVLGYMIVVNRIAYFVTRGIEVTEQDIVRVVGEPEITALGDVAAASRMVWHGPSNRVAFNAVGEGAETGSEIFYYDMGSGVLFHLTDKNTDDATADENPSWSPSGGHIVYSSLHTIETDDPAFRRELYIVSLSTKVARRITTSGQNESEPAWSPDGTRIAYVSDGDLYLLTLDQSLLP